MSNLLIVFVLFATFTAVALFTWAFNVSYAQKRRTLKLLESQVTDVSNLRQQQLTGSFLDRAILPFLQRFGTSLRRITPIDARKRIQKKLILAGSPSSWDADKIAGFKLLGVFFGLFLAWSIASGGTAPAGRSVAMAVLFAAIFYFAPDAVLNRVARERQDAIRKALPDTMDLLTISVEAGLGFDAALQQVLANVPGPLTQEIGRMMHEMRLGRSRVDAFRNLADRTDVEELRSFVLAMVQADTFGVSISKVLRAQAFELRTKRRQYTEEQAMKVPVKILFPLILCVLPALFVIILGPGVIQIGRNLFGANF